MADSVAAMLILALLLVVITLMARATIAGGTMMDLASKAAFDRAEDRARTNISVTSVTASGTSVTVKLKNTGATSVADFDKMDFIISYVSSSATVITRLTHTAGTLAADQWKRTSISPDTLEPNTWNESETLTLDALLGNTLDSASTGTVAVVTPHGVDALGFFTVP